MLKTASNPWVKRERADADFLLAVARNFMNL